MYNKMICINDNGRPNEIPVNKWVKKGEVYTAIGLIKCNTQGGAYGYILEEISLEGCDPYKCFGTYRFGILTLEDEIREAAVEDSLVEIE